MTQTDKAQIERLGAHGEIARLSARVAELEAENACLAEQLASPSIRALIAQNGEGSE